MTRYQTAAVVVGVDLNGLGVIRSLARAGVPVVAVDTDLGKPTMRTRFARKVPFQSLGGAAMIDELLSLAGSFATPPVLFLTQEASVRAVSEHRDRLAGRYRFLLPEHDLLMALMDKSAFQAMAESGGYAVPRAISLRRAPDIAEARALTFPCVLKPARKDDAYHRQFKKAYVVDSIEQTEALCREIFAVLPDMILQEWIEGGDASIYFCLQYRSADGRAVQSFSGRKLRAWPPRIGGTASCTAAPEAAAEIEAKTDGFFAAVGFVGMGGMEFKRDRRDGRFVMVEPTVGRTDYQAEVATLHGVNLPLAAYLDELGAAQPADAEIERKIVWRDPFADRYSAGAQGPADGVEIAGAPVVDGYWRAYDPMPGVMLYGDKALARLRRYLGRR